jgi:phenylpropionate dioxygenase-like ring-hydroxylating dioxygenase large terminal subunit
MSIGELSCRSEEGSHMQHDKQVEIIKTLMGHLDARTTMDWGAIRINDASVYASAERMERERAAIFREFPLVAALSADLPRPGHYVAGETAGVPTMVVRGRDGIARAFLDACRHRGSRLTSDCRGQTDGFRCPFHNWTYDLEGRLRGVPRSHSFGAFDREERGLLPLPVAEKYGLIWIRLAPGRPFDIDEHLAGLGPELEGWKLWDVHPFDAKAGRRKMNWKLAIDTFGETYHFEFLHRNTLDAWYHSNVLHYDIFGNNHRMVFAARWIDELRNRPESEWKLRPHATIAYYLFPNTQLLLSRGHVDVYRIFPGERPDSCVVHQAVYLDREPRAQKERETARRILEDLEDVIQREDFGVAESAQAALGSGMMRSVIHGRNEPALHHYHESFARALRRHGERGPAQPTGADAKGSG